MEFINLTYPTRTDEESLHHRADHWFIKQAEAGMAVSELARQHGFSPACFYAWRAKYGGMKPKTSSALRSWKRRTTGSSGCWPEAHLDIEALKIGFGVKR